MKKGYSRQHPGAAIVFVGKGGIAHRSMVPKPLAIDQKNLITEVKMHLIELLISIQLKNNSYAFVNLYAKSFL